MAPIVARGAVLQQAMLFSVVIPTFLAMGYSQPFLGGVISYPSFYRQFPTIDTVTTTGTANTYNNLIEGVANSTLNLGAVVGALSCMYIGNKLGRRRTVLMGSICTIIGTVLFCSSFSFAQLIVARLVLGFGVGMAGSQVPVWQAETSSTTNRGHHVIVDGICIGSGIALSAWITYAFSTIQTTNGWQWRIPAMAPGILSLIVALATFVFPESPRWLVLKGQHEAARYSQARFHDLDPEGEEVHREINALIRAHEMSETASFWSLFTMGEDKMLYRLFLACSSQWYSQMGGSALITYYSGQLFRTIGLSPSLSRILGASVLTFKAVCCLIPFFTIERFGRRSLFMSAGLGMTICMFCLAISGSQVTTTNLGPAYAGVVFAFLFVAFYPLGFLGVNFLYSQEVISTRHRAPASGISIATHWLTSFAVSLTTPLGFTAIGWRFYLIWGASAALIIPMVYFLYPETTGLSMEAIDLLFIESPSVLGTVGFAKHRRTEVFEKSQTASEDGVSEPHPGQQQKLYA